jgi:spore maturation protein CgeB
MRVVMFVHSVRSCWNHGNAHFLRGVARELLERGHTLTLYEPADGWSASNLLADHGPSALEGFRASYPLLDSILYAADTFDLDRALDRADLVLVHEWTPPALVARIGEKRRGANFRLLFHDTHHRAISDPEAMGALDLKDYDGVLAFGDVLRELYLRRSWSARAWTWHEAADVRVFAPQSGQTPQGDLVWIGNWGDGERTSELRTFLFEPARALGLKGAVYGVRYPEHARAAVAEAGLSYGGWLPNHEAPQVFPRYRFTVHVPRRPYVELLPGIPTIRVFEALACGIPLISAPWRDVEHLFEAGVHYLSAKNGRQMAGYMRLLTHDAAAGRELAARGRARILDRHTCAHRVDALLAIAQSLQPPVSQ